MPINWMDIAILFIILMYALIGFCRGLVLSFFHVVSTFGSLALTAFLYPYVGKLLKASFLDNIIAASVKGSLELKEFLPVNSLMGNQELINQMNLPLCIKKSLIENNNNVVYDILGVNNIKDYIYAYIANSLINIFSMVIVFFAVKIIIKLIARVLDLASKLPIINSFNKLLGLLFGVVQGIFTVWILFLVGTLFFTVPSFRPVYETLMESKIAIYLYNTNILMLFINSVFS